MAGPPPLRTPGEIVAMVARLAELGARERAREATCQAEIIRRLAEYEAREAAAQRNEALPLRFSPTGLSQPSVPNTSIPPLPPPLNPQVLYLLMDCYCRHQESSRRRQRHLRMLWHGQKHEVMPFP